MLDAGFLSNNVASVIARAGGVRGVQEGDARGALAQHESEVGARVRPPRRPAHPGRRPDRHHTAPTGRQVTARVGGDFAPSRYIHPTGLSV